MEVFREGVEVVERESICCIEVECSREERREDEIVHLVEDWCC